MGTISYAHGFVDARTKAIDQLREAQNDIAEGSTVKDRLQELCYSLMESKPNIGKAIESDHLEDSDRERRDRLLPDNEDYRKGYSAGYADAYGDVRHLKEKLTAMKDVIKRILERGYVSENIEEERGDYLALIAACNPVAMRDFVKQSVEDAP